MPALTLKDRVAALEADMGSLKEQLERSQALVGIEKGIRAMHKGDGKPAREAMDSLRKKHKIPAR